MTVTKYSPNYFEIIEKYKDFHVNGTKKLSGSQTFLGYSLVKWVHKIREIIITSNSKTIIDYGCGKAFLYNSKISIADKNYENLQEYWGIEEVFLYDPAVEKYSQQPQRKRDGIICTDVIEHIPEEDVLQFIEDIFKLANKFVFLVIATMPASKHFDNGKNIHLCIKSEREWGNIFSKFKEDYPKIEQYVFFNNNS
tara:strand:+ start:647 stop:1234 length:588 start_codon:yes stop_codon:yes gene_type:complete